jgi:hypothetical protein
MKHEDEPLPIPIPRAQRAQIRVRHESKEIAEFRDVQLAISIPVGHLKFSLYEVQQLSLADFADFARVRAFLGVF